MPIRKRARHNSPQVRILASLNHQGIAAIYGMVDNALVMEMVEGQSLEELLCGKEGGRLPLEEVLPVFSQVASALDHAHGQDPSVLHRDIKPANIMINSHGDAKVMDFGIARAVSDTQTALTATSAVMGTAQYLSPEQVERGYADARSDLYAAGVLLYEMLTGDLSQVNYSSARVGMLRAVAKSTTDPSARAPLAAICLLNFLMYVSSSLAISDTPPPVCWISAALRSVWKMPSKMLRSTCFASGSTTCCSYRAARN